MNDTIPVHMPRTVWGQLASIAEARGVTVADLITEGIREVLRVPLTGEQKIVAWTMAGIPDLVIAHRLSCSVETVRRVRRSRGIPAAKFRRADWPELVQPPALLGVSSSEAA